MTLCGIEGKFCIVLKMYSDDQFAQPFDESEE